MMNNRRKVNSNIYFLGVEGDDEYYFVEYLIEQYTKESIERNTIILRNAHGGSPASAINSFRRNNQIGSFTERLFIFDNDLNLKSIQKGIRACEKEPTFNYLLSNNRFEVEIFRLLDYPQAKIKYFLKSPARIVKEEFDNRVVAHDRTSIQQRYAYILPREKLQVLRKTNFWLNAILLFIEKNPIYTKIAKKYNI